MRPTTSSILGSNSRTMPEIQGGALQSASVRRRIFRSLRDHPGDGVLFRASAFFEIADGEDAGGGGSFRVFRKNRRRRSVERSSATRPRNPRVIPKGTSVAAMFFSVPAAMRRSPWELFPDARSRARTVPGREQTDFEHRGKPLVTARMPMKPSAKHKGPYSNLRKM